MCEMNFEIVARERSNQESVARSQEDGIVSREIFHASALQHFSSSELQSFSTSALPHSHTSALQLFNTYARDHEGVKVFEYEDLEEVDIEEMIEETPVTVVMVGMN